MIFTKIINKKFLRYLAWILLFILILTASSFVNTGKAFRSMREESALGVEYYPEIRPYINHSARSAMDLLALKNLSELYSEHAVPEAQLEAGEGSEKDFKTADRAVPDESPEEVDSDFANESINLDLIEDLELSDRSEEYLESLASEIKPLAFEIYLFPLISTQDRQGQFPSNRLSYPPPAEAKLIFASPFEFEIPPETRANYAFVNRNYLAQNVGSPIHQIDDAATISYGFNSDQIYYSSSELDFDFQILVYTTLTKLPGRQSTMLESVISRRDKILAMEPKHSQIVFVSVVFYLLSFALLCTLLHYAWQSQPKTSLPLDFFALICFYIFSLPYAFGTSSTNSFSPRRLFWQIILISAIWTIPLFCLCLLIYAATAQYRNNALRKNLLITRLLTRIKRSFQAFRKADKSWPTEVRRHNRWSFLLVIILLILIATGPRALALILLIPLFYIGYQFFMEMSHLIQTAEQPILASAPDPELDSTEAEKSHGFRLFTLLQPLEEALERNHRISAENLKAKLKSERMRSELITNVSHDIKTPLTSIMSYGNLLHEQLLEEQYQNQVGLDYLEIILKQTRRLQRLSNDLIESSKLHSGVVHLELSVLNLNEFLNQALAEYIELFKDRQLELIAEVSEEVFVIADGDALWRVLGNLLNNIAQYSRPESRVYLSLEVDQEEGYAQLWLRNLSKEALNMPSEDLLERFVQGNTARNSEGSGLGLSIASSLMELMYGKLNLEVVADLFTAELVIPLAPLTIGSESSEEESSTNPDSPEPKLIESDSTEPDPQDK
ncbi:MAG: histidine kinase dimerization/phospho-acceptor domain-containing protein [Eubacteriales bacterium]|nr:histidine kinase dimerization/phospho-acceptor domain-containing protein [Eubacteriales bacterium]